MNRFDPIQSSTDLSLPDGTTHHGRKLMSYQEEKALSFYNHCIHTWNISFGLTEI